jgi:acyl-CoA hydrolase
MRGLRYRQPHHLGKLHLELLAAIPGLQPIEGSARCIVSGDGISLQLSVPDEIDPLQIQAVVEAHDPTPPPPPEDAHQRALGRVRELYAATQAATTIAQLKQALVGTQRVLARYLAAQAAGAADADEEA